MAMGSLPTRAPEMAVGSLPPGRRRRGCNSAVCWNWAAPVRATAARGAMPSKSPNPTTGRRRRCEALCAASVVASASRSVGCTTPAASRPVRSFAPMSKHAVLSEACMGRTSLPTRPNGPLRWVRTTMHSTSQSANRTTGPSLASRDVGASCVRLEALTSPSTHPVRQQGGRRSVASPQHYVSPTRCRVNTPLPCRPKST